MAATHTKFLTDPHMFQSLHAAPADGDPAGMNPVGMDPAASLIATLIDHIGRPPRVSIGITDPRGYERIVRRARAFIHDNLGSPLSVELIASAAATSPRTLHRAFRTLLDETPYSYVMKLRLHRIRYDVISDTEMTMTLATIANQWGISELGRLSGWYRDLFGELPSQTRKRRLPSPVARAFLN